MLEIKSAQINNPSTDMFPEPVNDIQNEDFNDENIRRLLGQLTEIKKKTDSALDLLERYLRGGQINLSIQDIREDNSLRYYIEGIFGTDYWESVTSDWGLWQPNLRRMIRPEVSDQPQQQSLGQ